MGHERIGVLPKSQKWQKLVEQIGSAYSGDVPIATVATETLKNVKTRYNNLSEDNTVKAAFESLVVLSRICGSEDPVSAFQDADFSIPDQPTIFSIIKAIKEKVPQAEANSEYGKLALDAAVDAISQWHRQKKTTQIPLFESKDNLLQSWRKLSSGAGFCELSRLFFGNLTERYLNYFLDREASARAPSLQQREKFQNDLKSHIDEISKHAFETAKITQSFAAGWFKLHAKDHLPNEQEIRSFLRVAFGKLCGELRLEEEAE